MSGFVDLHLHYVPGVDDGARSNDEALAICAGLKSIGFSLLVTTPHIRSGMFDNNRADLQRAFDAFQQLAGQSAKMPELALSAEHHCDGALLELLQHDGLLPYPGARAILIEFAYEAFPVAVEQVMYKLALKRLRPIIAHPERYAPLFKRTDPIDKLLDQDVGLQLDVMSLLGRYGRAPRSAAERMLDEGVYTVAATDTHRPEDISDVGKAIELLHKRVGDDEARLLLSDNPRRLLQGAATQ